MTFLNFLKLEFRLSEFFLSDMSKEIYIDITIEKYRYIGTSFRLPTTLV
jgi:hypothetical protein